MLGSLITGGLSLLGGLMSNEANEDQASANQAFQERMSNTSYQRGMADMRAAGLNPMLAFSQGGASVPTGSMARLENPFAAASQAYSQNVAAEASTSSANAANVQAETAKRIGDASIEKIKQETANAATDNDRLKAVVKNLGEEYQNLVKDGWNKTEIGNHLRSQIRRITAEIPNLHEENLRIAADTALKNINAKLTGLDVSAAEKFDNFGREFQQYRPIIELLKSVLGSRR